MDTIDIHYGIGYDGWCGFCGAGDGHLGEQGDERSELLNAAVRSGEGPYWNYAAHPGAIKNDHGGLTFGILWCGICDLGLAHKYQRFTDHNLQVQLMIYKTWNDLDGCKWDLWNLPQDDPAWKNIDDPAIHLVKRRRQDEIPLLEREVERRKGL